jgi:hypothetical protein
MTGMRDWVGKTQVRVVCGRCGVLIRRQADAPRSVKPSRDWRPGHLAEIDPCYPCQKCGAEWRPGAAALTAEFKRVARLPKRDRVIRLPLQVT